MAEYVLGPDEDQTKVVQELLANAKHPDDVQWRPRSGVAHGGVYEIPDELSDRLIEHRRALADAETARIEEALTAADERDAAPGVAEGLVTPEEAGFHANTAGDPGAAVDPARDFDADTLSDEEWAAKYPGQERPAPGTDGQLEGDPDDADPAEPPAEEPAEQPAARKKARRTAKSTTEAAADPAAEETK